MVVGEIVNATDVLIVGAGPGGYTAAIRAAELGLDVTLVEKATVGGVCLHTGCIPTKVWLHAAEQVAAARQAATAGLGTYAPPRELQAVVARGREVVGELERRLTERIRQAGVRLIRGTARFVQAGEVRVEQETGSEVYRYRHAVLATGSHARLLPGLPVDGQRVLLARDVFRLERLPEHLLVVGGGYIGLELGTALLHLGARVTLLEAESSLLPTFDQDLVRTAMRHLQSEGMEIRTAARVLGGSADERGVRLELATASGRELVEGSHCLVAVGRQPNLESLGLEDLGLASTTDGIPVDRQGRTQLPGVFAVGDVTGQPLFAHRAMQQGLVAAETMAGRAAEFRADFLPHVVFTEPELAYVGLRPEMAEDPSSLRVLRFPLTILGRATASGVTQGLVKLVVEKGTDVLVGGGVAAPGAGDLIAELALALEMGATLRDVADTLHAHPTFSEVWREGALALLDSPIHLPRQRPEIQS